MDKDKILKEEYDKAVKEVCDELFVWKIRQFFNDYEMPKEEALAYLEEESPIDGHKDFRVLYPTPALNAMISANMRIEKGETEV